MRLISHSVPEAHAYRDTPYLALELIPKVSPCGFFPRSCSLQFRGAAWVPCLAVSGSGASLKPSFSPTSVAQSLIQSSQ